MLNCMAMQIHCCLRRGRPPEERRERSADQVAFQHVPAGKVEVRPTHDGEEGRERKSSLERDTCHVLERVLRITHRVIGIDRVLEIHPHFALRGAKP